DVAAWNEDVGDAVELPSRAGILLAAVIPEDDGEWSGAGRFEQVTLEHERAVREPDSLLRDRRIGAGDLRRLPAPGAAARLGERRDVSGGMRPVVKQMRVRNGRAGRIAGRQSCPRQAEQRGRAFM